MALLLYGAVIVTRNIISIAIIPEVQHWTKTLRKINSITNELQTSKNMSNMLVSFLSQDKQKPLKTACKINSVRYSARTAAKMESFVEPNDSTK